MSPMTCTHACICDFFCAQLSYSALKFLSLLACIVIYSSSISILCGSSTKINCFYSFFLLFSSSPNLKKTVDSRQKLIAESHRKQAECVRNIEHYQKQYAAACKNVGIEVSTIIIFFRECVFIFLLSAGIIYSLLFCLLDIFL